MGDFDGFDSFEEDDWEEGEDGEVMDVKAVKGRTADGEAKRKGDNVALLAFTKGGKSMTAALYGYLNTDYFDKFNVKENFPKVYQLIKEGYVPEIEKIDVLDLDGSFDQLGHKGAFWTLTKHLWRDGRIDLTENLEIPKVDVDSVSQVARNVAKKKIDEAKLRIENTISQRVKDNPETTCLVIDSMSSYDELLNDKFRLLYEDVLAEKDKRHIGGSLDGVKQSYWKIRNGWWVETLRDKRKYPGWQIDTYKLEDKQYTWLQKEIDAAKKHPQKTADDVLPFNIIWAPRTTYDLDFVHLLRGQGDDLWMETMNRYEKSESEAEFSLKDLQRINYTKNRRSAVYEILEQLAPSIMGEIEEDGELLEDDDLWL